MVEAFVRPRPKRSIPIWVAHSNLACTRQSPGAELISVGFWPMRYVMKTSVLDQPLRLRRMRFSYPESMDVVWHPTIPEFACAANGVSMLMPYVEPYVVRSVRNVAPLLEGQLRSTTSAYLHQEGQHHAQHRRFNDLVVGRFPRLALCERLMSSVFRRLTDLPNQRFGVAFAAGFETVAYAAARWTADNANELLTGADPQPAALFLWHLAEEVEHKSVAMDVYRSIGGSRPMYAAAMTLSAVLLALFAWLNTMIMLVATRRVLHPMAHVRLLKWTMSFLFELLPTMVISISKNHHPSQMTDPLLYELWLQENHSQ
jgi:predicted metal-dependent hydrolase